MRIIDYKDMALAPLLHHVPPFITPNHLATVRLLLALPLIILLLQEHLILAFTIFVITMVLDAIDGSLARLRHTTSAIGEVLDPMADKAIFISAFVILGYGTVPLNLFLTILMLEVITFLGSLLSPIITKSMYGFTVAVKANIFGQLKLTLYSVAMILLFLVGNNQELQLTANGIFILGVLSSFTSMIYFAVQMKSR